MNRLANETSPYLLQHKNNPVDWYPWGPEALEQARDEGKPIFLSIGYSACHWCHVMEHESFENEKIAAFLNQHFISIKVDREERPDLDHIYMNAVQMMTGRGGWPMSVFLTPDLKPFFGGTYWPPENRMGMPSFGQILAAVHDAWLNRRDAAEQQAAQLTEAIARMDPGGEDPVSLNEDLLTGAATKLERVFDWKHGGFGPAPKFPHAADLQFLLRVAQRLDRPRLVDMVRLTLDKMAAGGIYDHLAGGFARYSVDAHWLVPHFEKMLYDNALLTEAYLEAFLVTRDESYARVAREIVDYILTYMTDDLGGFHSAEDADSEGVEGKFYVWTVDEVKDVLGEQRGERFCYVYNVEAGGNFEGQSILNLPKTIEQCAQLREWDLPSLKQELAQSRRELLAVRDQRVRPGKDDKVLVSWNALMINALARAATILDRPQYLDAARRAAEFLLEHVKRPDGRLLHCWRHGTAKLDAYLDDYTYLINAMVTLYEADFDVAWIEKAVSLADTVLAHFSDDARGGFFYTADDHEQLITRTKDLYDSSVPSGNAMAATALARLASLCGRTDFTKAALGALEMAGAALRDNPTACGQMLIAADYLLGPTRQLAVVGESHDQLQPVVRDLRRVFLPRAVVAVQSVEQPAESPLAALFAGKTTVNGEVTAYICEDFACQQPISGQQAIQNAVELLPSLKSG
jgi:uncharacterized protein YyaL (SSP411 family)